MTGCPGPSSGSPGRPASPAAWLPVARDVAADLATDAVARDHANRPPFDEVSRLRESGLLELLIPTDRGGGGADWPTAFTVVREVSTADGCIGQLLGYHYLLSSHARFFGSPAVAEEVERRSASQRWFWGGAYNPLDPELSLTPDGDAFRLDGRKSFATGAQVADRLLVVATRADTGEPLVLTVDPAESGVVCNDDWDNFGMRLTASGSVEFDAVPVRAGDVIGGQGTDESALPPFATLITPTAQLMFTQLYVGIAEGALAEARDYTRSASRAWPLSGVESPVEDPYVLATYGELTATARSARALADQAVTAVSGALARQHAVTAGERGEIAVLVATAKVAATRAALDVTARVLELTGARSTASELGFDRFWRNVRTHTLHDPVAYKLREVGDHFLNGSHPPFTLYT